MMTMIIIMIPAPNGWPEIEYNIADGHARCGRFCGP